MALPILNKTGVTLLTLAAFSSTGCEQKGFSSLADLRTPPQLAPDLSPFFSVDRYDPVLAKTLRREWNFPPEKLLDFTQASTDPGIRSFFLNPQNAERSRHVFKLYDVSASSMFLSMQELVESLKPVVNHYDIIRSDSCCSFIRDQFKEFYREVDGKIGVQKFAEIVRIESLPQQKDFQEISSYLRDRYEMTANEICCFLGDRVVDRDLIDRLGSTDVLACFKRLSRTWGTTERDRLLSGLLLSDNFERCEQAIVKACEYLCVTQEQPIFSEPYERQVSRIVLEHPLVRDALLDPVFKTFLDEVDVRSETALTPFDLVPIARLFARYSGDTKLFCGVTKAMEPYTEWVQKRTDLGRLSAFEVEALSRLCDDGSLPAMKDLVESLEKAGECISRNDLVFLSWLATTPESMALLKERSALEGLLPSTFCGDQVVRQAGNESSALPPSGLFVLHPSPQLERPSPAVISTVNLARIAAIASSLQGAEVRQQLAQILMRDLYDRRTEKGGIITIADGQINFELSPGKRIGDSFFSKNGAYAPSHSNEMLPGIATFHLHATDKDCRPYSGPSGSYTSTCLGGDTAYVRYQDVLDVVVTTLGHPKGFLGEEDKSQIELNLDAYYYDRRAGIERIVVVDLGTITVPRLK